MTKTKSYKQWLVLDWKTGSSRTRKSKPGTSELGANELLAELKVDVEVPEVDVPTLAVQIDVPEPQVYQATMEALDDKDLPDWTDAANTVLAEHQDAIHDATDGDELAALIDRLVTTVLMDAPGRPPVEQVRAFMRETSKKMWTDEVDADVAEAMES